MKKALLAAVTAAIVLATGGLAVACHIAQKSASIDCEGQLRYAFAADAARSTQHTVVFVDGTQVQDSYTTPFSGSVSADPSTQHQVVGKLYWQGHLEDTETLTTVPAEDCTRAYAWRINLRMTPVGPIDQLDTFDVRPGTAVSAVITRAPHYMKVRLYAGGVLVFGDKYPANPGRTTLRVRIGTVDVQQYARLAGKAPATHTFTGVVS